MGLIRLFLALAVVHAHVHERIPGVRAIGGDVAVQSFFVISGFYMALVLNTKYGVADTITFYKARALRLLPTYYLVLAFAIIAGLGLSLANKSPLPWGQWGDGTPLNMVNKAFMGTLNLSVFGQELPLFLAGHPDGTMFLTKNFIAEQKPLYEFALNPPAWSLSLEMMFYILAPFLVRRKPAVLVSIIVAAFALRFGMTLGLGLGNDPWTYRFFPFEIGTFLLGSLSYHVYATRVKPMDLSQRKTLILAAAYLFWLLAPYVPGPMPIIIYPFVTALMLPFVFSVTKSSSWDRKIGELSFPVYICHWPILKFLAALSFFGISGWPRQFLVIPLVTLVAWAIYRYFEEPIERKRQAMIAARSA